jgi:hypothetical protein
VSTLLAASEASVSDLRAAVDSARTATDEAVRAGRRELDAAVAEASQKHAALSSSLEVCRHQLAVAEAAAVEAKAAAAAATEQLTAAKELAAQLRDEQRTKEDGLRTGIEQRWRQDFEKEHETAVALQSALDLRVKVPCVHHASCVKVSLRSLWRGFRLVSFLRVSLLYAGAGLHAQ